MRSKRPHLSVLNKSAVENVPVFIRGFDWPDTTVSLYIGGKPARIPYIVEGYPVPGGVRPVNGKFALRIATYGLNRGRHSIRAVGSGGGSASISVDLQPPPRANPKRDVNLTYARSMAEFVPRFGHIGYVPRGIMTARYSSLPGLISPHRWRDPNPPPPGPPPVTNHWAPIGPAPFIDGGMGTSVPANSGRIRAIAIDPMTPTNIYIGVSRGGVWKSTDGGLTFLPATDFQPDLAISALAIDPNNPNRVFAGTGEYTFTIGPSAGYWGNGLLYSSDYGANWIVIAASQFNLSVITRILFDPQNSATHMFLSCDMGVYESNDGGNTWALLAAGAPAGTADSPGGAGGPGDVSDLVMIASGAPETIQLIAGYAGQGLYSNTLANGAWSGWSQIAVSLTPASVGRIALGQSANNPTTIWAVFADSSGSVIAGIASTSDGVNWNAVTGPGAAIQIWATFYNLYVAVHPNTPTTIFLGVVTLSMSTNGAAPWTDISLGTTGTSPTRLHTDQHALAFDPLNPNTMFVCNDGGLYITTDGAVTWQQCNTTLNTLQFYCMSQHPTYSGLIAAGTQDNGGGFYNGAPGWIFDQWGGASHNTIQGDITAIAIDPVNPQTIYYGLYGQVYQSTDGGQFWNLTAQPDSAMMTGAAWNFPLVLDPNTSGVCYVGSTSLLRSDDGLATVTAIFTPLNDVISAIAIHPTNSNNVYVGTVSGSVYLVSNNGMTWSSTPLSAPPLPAGLNVSSIAVDTTGAVWVSFSSVIYVEATGEFSNDHVYFLPPNGSSWNDQSAGLAQANPINTIVIDPSNNDNVFCGGDSGVFQWSAASGSWSLWNDSLPNVPVYQLAIHNPTRLIRAATFGRGIWQRPVDPVSSPLVDIYIRDDILDDGIVPAPVGESNPFSPSDFVWWWQSPDITIDASNPPQTPSPVTDAVSLANLIVDGNPTQGATVILYVQVHNRGPNPATGVTVIPLFADASAGLPDLPSDFWTGGNPFAGTANAASWTPVGPASSPITLNPCCTAVLSWSWSVPANAAPHTCMLVLATSNEDPLTVSGVFDVATVVTGQNNVAQRNLHII